VWAGGLRGVRHTSASRVCSCMATESWEGTEEKEAGGKAGGEHVAVEAQGVEENLQGRLADVGAWVKGQLRTALHRSRGEKCREKGPHRSVGRGFRTLIGGSKFSSDRAWRRG